ncbi:MAG: PIN domain-containing protein [Acidimicrobiales bacterium]
MGLIHLDAGVVIGLLDGTDAHHASSTRSLAEALRAGHRLAMAASAFAECLVGPSRRGQRAVDTVDDLFARLPIEIVPLDAAIARMAAGIRAKHTSMRLPDTFVIATAALASADRLVTTDRRWPAARKLGIGTVIDTI